MAEFPATLPGFSSPVVKLADGIVGTDETLAVISDDVANRFVLDDSLYGNRGADVLRRPGVLSQKPGLPLSLFSRLR